jgi:TetR/AcrR family transcriptional regulator
MSETPERYTTGRGTPASRLRSLVDGQPADQVPPPPDSPPGRILAAARDLCAERGFPGVTVRAVAQQAGVNPAMINYYFGTKDRLVDAVVTHQLQLLLRDVLEGLDQEAAGERLLAEFPLRILDSFRRDPKRLRLIRLAVSTEPDRLRRIIRSLGQHSVLGVSGVMLELVADLQAAGRVADVPPRSVMLFLVANAYGLVFMEQIAREVTGFELEDDGHWREHRAALEQLLRQGLQGRPRTKEGGHA